MLHNKIITLYFYFSNLLDKMNKNRKEESGDEESPIFGRKRTKTFSKSRFSRSPHNINSNNTAEIINFSNQNSKSINPIDINIDNNNHHHVNAFDEKEESSKLMEVSVLDLNTNEPKKLIENESSLEKIANNILQKIPKIDETTFNYTEEIIENNRTRSRSGNLNNKTKSNLTEKLAQIQVMNTIKELKHPNLDELNKPSEDYLMSPTLNLVSPTLKKNSLFKDSQINQLRNQVKFLNNVVLTFTLIAEFIQKLTDENKIPFNLKFWFNEQKTNLEFLIGKILENELSLEYLQKGDDIKKFNEKLLHLAEVFFFFLILKYILLKNKKKISFVKRMREKENLLDDLESDFSQTNTNKQRKHYPKFSIYSTNDAKYISYKNRAQSFKRKFIETKAKSEEKYTGGPLYQVFIAKYPELQTLSIKFSNTFERKSKTGSLILNSAGLKKNPDNCNNESDQQLKIEEDLLQIHSTPRKKKKKMEEKTSITRIKDFQLFFLY